MTEQRSHTTSASSGNCQFIKRSGKCREPATHETANGIAMCKAHWHWCEGDADLAFLPEICPKCGSDDLHSASMNGEEAIDCGCGWIKTHAELRSDEPVNGDTP